MEDKSALTASVSLRGRSVVLVGEGPVADKHRALLKRSGAKVVEEGSKAGFAVVIDDPAAVSRLKVRGALVYAVDRPDLSNFVLAKALEQRASSQPSQRQDKPNAILKMLGMGARSVDEHPEPSRSAADATNAAEEQARKAEALRAAEEHGKLQKEHAKLTEEHTRLVQDHAKLAGDHARLVDEHKALDGEHVQLADTQAKLADDHARLLTEHQELTRQHARLTDERSNLAENHARLAAEHRELTDRQVRLAEEPAKLEAEHARLADEHRKLVEDHARLAQEPIRLSEEIARLVGENTKLAADNARIASDAPKLAEEHASLMRKHATLEEKHRKLLQEQTRAAEPLAPPTQMVESTKPAPAEEATASPVDLFSPTQDGRTNAAELGHRVRAGLSSALSPFLAASDIVATAIRTRAERTRERPLSINLALSDSMPLDHGAPGNHRGEDMAPDRAGRENVQS